jgi:hypothetical protein
MEPNLCQRRSGGLGTRRSLGAYFVARRGGHILAVRNASISSISGLCHGRTGVWVARLSRRAASTSQSRGCARYCCWARQWRAMRRGKINGRPVRSRTIPRRGFRRRLCSVNRPPSYRWSAWCCTKAAWDISSIKGRLAETRASASTVTFVFYSTLNNDSPPLDLKGNFAGMLQNLRECGHASDIRVVAKRAFEFQGFDALRTSILYERRQMMQRWRMKVSGSTRNTSILPRLCLARPARSAGSSRVTGIS